MIIQGNILMSGQQPTRTLSKDMYSKTPMMLGYHVSQQK